MEGDSYEDPRENKFVSRDRQCHENKLNASTNNLSLRSKNILRKPDMFYITFNCYNFNQAQARPSEGEGLEETVTDCRM